MNIVYTLSAASAILQVSAYLVYLHQASKDVVEPNPLHWLMCAYGMIFFVVLEWNAGVSLPLLAMPAACAVMSVLVAVHAFRDGINKERIERSDLFAFGFDVMLTIVYATASILEHRGILTEAQLHVANIATIIAWNISILTTFYPTIRETLSCPHQEHPLAWTMWAGAYVLLLVATILSGGDSVHLLYPTLEGIVHVSVAFLAYRHVRNIACPA
jgi:hypothetical protein